MFTDTVYASEDGGSFGSENAGGVASPKEDPSNSASDSAVRDASEEEAGQGTGRICVFVCGAVADEGVYELPENSRIIDAVEAAGGYSEDADRAYVNQAEYVYDTQRIEIPTIEEALELRQIERAGAGEGTSPAGEGQEDGLININTADAGELMKIPGIGESKAERIIEYRQLHGRFGSTEELMNVSGIGSGIYENMKDHITVN